MNWFLVALSKYADFEGRARRKEFWFFTLFYYVFLMLVALLDSALGTFVAESEIGLLTCLFGLPLLVPSISVTVRRLHDIGLSGWWWFIGLITMVGAILLLVLAMFDGQRGANRFGPDPKQDEP
ncbi:MAG: DUF805 domain-containing protein [Gammaproteobacteria bacterium]|nr:DUF805 domain-containing protein [Gammaproteobacteria bacterium]